MIWIKRGGRGTFVLLISFILIANCITAAESQTFTLDTLASIVPDTSPTERLAEINQEIKDSGAEWQAALTPKALLSTAEKRRLLGSFITEIKGETREAMIQASGALPSSFDWRQKDSVNWMTSVKDQGNCGSCWFHVS